MIKLLILDTFTRKEKKYHIVTRIEGGQFASVKDSWIEYSGQKDKDGNKIYVPSSNVKAERFWQVKFYNTKEEVTK